MDSTFLLKGLIIGIAIAAPVGPIGVLCIRRTLTEGRISGLVSGLGAATADAIYGSIAGFGLTFISGFLIHSQILIRLAGGIFLCYLGVKTFLSAPSHNDAMISGKGLVGSYTTTFFLTLTNPMTIISFTAIFAGLGIGGLERNYGAAGMLILGVFLGSSLWWFILSGGVGIFRKRFSSSSMQFLNRIAGIIIGGFGLFVLSSLILLLAGTIS